MLFKDTGRWVKPASPDPLLPLNSNGLLKVSPSPSSHLKTAAPAPKTPQCLREFNAVRSTVRQLRAAT